MRIYPAIDLRGGKCVRLTEGDFAKETIFSDSPAAMAVRWKNEGAEFLHVVDLDGAVAGVSQNMAAIKSIIEVVNIPVQLGGGIRSMENIENWLNLGVNRVILGSAAVRNPQLVAEACKKFPERIVVGIDARDGYVAVDGWGKNSQVKATDLASSLADYGVAAIIFTDISRDGTLSGVNAEATAEIAVCSGIPVIASGGVASLEDIRRLLPYEKQGISGCIIGKAIYTGAVKLEEAIKLAGEKRC